MLSKVGDELTTFHAFSLHTRPMLVCMGSAIGRELGPVEVQGGVVNQTAEVN